MTLDRIALDGGITTAQLNYVGDAALPAGHSPAVRPW